MGIWTTIFAGTVTGIFVGLFIVIVYKFIKTFWENRNVFKMAPDIAKQILDEKTKSEEVKNARFKKEETREQRRGITRSSEERINFRPSQVPVSDGQRRVSLSEYSFILRD